MNIKAISAQVGIANKKRNRRTISTSGAATIVHRQCGTPATTSFEKNKYAVEGTWAPANTEKENIKAEATADSGSKKIRKGSTVAMTREYWKTRPSIYNPPPVLNPENPNSFLVQRMMPVGPNFNRSRYTAGRVRSQKDMMP